MIDDGNRFPRLAQNTNFPLQSAATGLFPASGCASKLKKMGFKAWVRSSTDQMHNIAGPGDRKQPRESSRRSSWTAPVQPADREA